jgi:hypothetical protein
LCSRFANLIGGKNKAVNCKSTAVGSHARPRIPLVYGHPTVYQAIPKPKAAISNAAYVCK